MADQNPACREHHSVFDVLTNVPTNGDLKKPGYGWMTTRTASPPIGYDAAECGDADLVSNGPKKKKVVYTLTLSLRSNL